MAQYLSNEGLIYGVIRRGKHIMETRQGFHAAIYLGGLDITFGDDYNFEFNIKDSYWSQRIDRNSSVYVDVMQSMYFDAYQVLVEKHYSVVHYYEDPKNRHFTPREDVEMTLTSITQRYGTTYYMSQFLIALLRTDFLERPDIELPEYVHRNLG